MDSTENPQYFAMIRETAEVLGAIQDQLRLGKGFVLSNRTSPSGLDRFVAREKVIATRETSVHQSFI